MPSNTQDAFLDERLRFSIRKPPRWRFREPGWSPAALPGPLESLDWARYGRLPFVAIARDIRGSRHPRPLLSVGCRPVGRHTSAEVRRLLERQAELARAELDDVAILDCSYDAILGGYRAAHVRFEYSQRVSARSGPWSMRVLARSYLVMTPGLAFTIGVSTSADPRYGVPEEVAAALGSIRIGRARERSGAAAPRRDTGGRAC